MKQIRKTAIIGMGAIGILYGSRLLQNLGPDAVCYPVSPARLARFQQQGIRCNGVDCAFTVIDETQSAEPADLVIFAVKATALESAIETARCVIGPDTTIISMMNGISSEELLGEAFGQERIVYAVALGMDAARQGNEVNYTRFGKTVLGIPADQAEKQTRLDAVVELFQRADMPVEVSGDILKQLWGKFMLNVGVNQITMIYEDSNCVFQQPGEARELMIRAMSEIVTLSQAEGVNLTQANLEQYLSIADGLPSAGQPSMRQDGMAHRRSEVELFSGTAVRLGEKHGLPVPANQEIYRRVREMEAQY